MEELELAGEESVETCLEQESIFPQFPVCLSLGPVEDLGAPGISILLPMGSLGHPGQDCPSTIDKQEI